MKWYYNYQLRQWLVTQIVPSHCPNWELNICSGMLMFWYRNQSLCIKCDSVLSEKFSVTNGIKQGDILSPKLFNNYVNTVNVSLNEKYIGCYKLKCCESSLLCRWLVLVSPTASAMNEFLRVCEQFSENFELKFNEQKTVLLYFMPEKLRIKLGTSVMMSDTVIKIESSCRYLSHMITGGLGWQWGHKTPVTFFLW